MVLALAVVHSLTGMSGMSQGFNCGDTGARALFGTHQAPDHDDTFYSPLVTMMFGYALPCLEDLSPCFFDNNAIYTQSKHGSVTAIRSQSELFHQLFRSFLSSVEESVCSSQQPASGRIPRLILLSSRELVRFGHLGRDTIISCALQSHTDPIMINPSRHKISVREVSRRRSIGIASR
ncbi:hypothetical protein AC578_8310 [Pseudocercospora eumusae]|uniref:Uncharacterized protein n=1 Tax=Pseudocercospora eumusae TaxID=321146 RepID=A0A139H2Z2_9PEZI|nr:hypothetical protein AC578_8310 [Pseudocercospora eumusae]